MTDKKDIELRDYFAGLAMQAMIAKSGGTMESIVGKKGRENIPKFAYEYADAMIAHNKVTILGGGWHVLPAKPKREDFLERFQFSDDTPVHEEINEKRFGEALANYHDTVISVLMAGLRAIAIHGDQRSSMTAQRFIQSVLDAEKN